MDEHIALIMQLATSTLDNLREAIPTATNDALIYYRSRITTVLDLVRERVGEINNMITPEQTNQFNQLIIELEGYIIALTERIILNILNFNRQ